MIEGRLKNALGNIDLGYSIANIIWTAVLAITSFALPAWAVSAAGLFERFAPLSWVIAGFAGLFLAVVSYAVYAWARGRSVRARYDRRLLTTSGPIDPLGKTFERQRIYLNDFVLPSHPLVESKTFIDCQIIGPANVILVAGNSISEPQLPHCDAVLMLNGCVPRNAFAFTNCTFRGCSFQRVTILFPISEMHIAKGVNWLNWLTPNPNTIGQGELPLQSDPAAAIAAPNVPNEKS